MTVDTFVSIHCKTGGFFHRNRKKKKSKLIEGNWKRSGEKR